MSTTLIDNLSAEQAQRAVLAFFDSLPEDAWAQDSKPSPGRVVRAIERGESQLPDDNAETLRALRESVSGQSEIARFTLKQLHDIPEFSPLVESAIAEAAKPHMSALPPEAAYILVAVLAMAFNYTRTKKETVVRKEIRDGAEVETTTHSESSGGFNLLDAVAKGLPAVVDVLPKIIPGFLPKS